MSAIIIATITIGAIGLVVGLALVYIGNKFHVEVDEKEVAIREALPGNNCGACGYAGCDAMAAAMASGEASASGCPVGGAPVAEKINAILGTSAEAAEKQVAFVRCNGNCDNTSNRNNYVGIGDCRAARLSGLYPGKCDYGCLGFGSCVKVCPADAIHVRNGVAVVDPGSCVGCGLCAKECPLGLIELVPYKQKTFVRCMNHDKGKDVRNACKVGCIACHLCEKNCEAGAIKVEGDLAAIDYSKCENCGKCAEKCPQKTILDRGAAAAKAV